MGMQTFDYPPAEAATEAGVFDILDGAERDICQAFEMTEKDYIDTFWKGDLGAAFLAGQGKDRRGPVAMSELEPTDAEVAAAKAMGVWSDEQRVRLIRLKAAELGVALPAGFGEKKGG